MRQYETTYITTRYNNLIDNVISAEFHFFQDGGAGRLQYRITTYCEIREIDSARTRIILLGAHRGETSTRLASAMRGGLNRERF